MGGGHGGCKQRIEAFVKIDFFLGGGVWGGGGGWGGRVGGRVWGSGLM